MNGGKAKKLRKEVYGDKSLRQRREYERLRNQRHGKTGEMTEGTIINKPGSLRAKYQRAKRAA